jgi:ATP-binding cassette subfamily B protein
MAADEILVLANGRIQERGTHLQLMQQDGIYKELYRTQFKQVLNPPLAGQDRAG